MSPEEERYRYLQLKMKAGGLAPEIPAGPKTIQEMHPDFTLADRLIVKNLSSNPESAINYLKEKHPGLDVQLGADGEIKAKRQNEADYRMLDPQTGIFGAGLKENLRDLGDVVTDVGAGIGSSAATAAGGITGLGAGGVGALPGAALAGSATSAALETARQGLGSALGLKNNISGKDIALQGAVGAVSPLLFGTGATAAQIAEHAGLDEAKQAAVKETQRGLVGKLGSALKESAETKAYKALGPYAREAQKDYAKNQINQMGREVLDSGALSGWIPKSYSGVEDNLVEAAKKAGSNVGAIVEKLDKSGAIVPKQDVADMVSSALTVAKEVPGSSARNEANNLFVNEFLMQNKDMGIQEAQRVKKLIGDSINWNRLPGTDIPESEQRLRALYTALNKTTESASESAAGKLSEATKDSFIAAKKKYGLLKEANNIVSKRSSKELANRLISPSDYISGGLGAVAGFSSGDNTEDRIKRAVVGAGLGAVNKFGRTYGNQFSAKILDTAGGALQSPSLQRIATPIWNMMR